MALRKYCATVVVLAALACVGCGGPTLQPISGTVTLDGTPLAGARVAAQVKNSPETRPYTGDTDAQGHFALGSLEKPGGGAEVGDYTLTITTNFSPSNADEFTPSPTERVPAPYPAGVDFTVPEGGNTAANFELESK